MRADSGADGTDSAGSSPWRVGVHTSIAGSLDRAGEHASRIGGNTLQIFSCSPRMWRARDLLREEISSFTRVREQRNLFPLVVHCNYLINMASPDPVLRERSREAFIAEIQRAEAMQAHYLVLHPGSFREGSPEQGIRHLAASVRSALREAPPVQSTILIENMCGQGSVLGGTFEQLQEVLALLEGLPVAACVDTAHCYGAGIDLSAEAGLRWLVEAVSRTIGWSKVPVIHANDSRARLGSRLDRHEHIGRGGIGSEGFRRIVNHPQLRDKIFVLETPLEEDGDDQRNLETLRSLRADSIAKTSPARAPRRKAVSMKPGFRSSTVRKAAK